MKEALIIIGMLLLAGSIFYTWQATDECNKRGGELVRGYSGIPVCVKSPEVLP